MKRWHEEWRITHREWKKHRLIHVELNQSLGVGSKFYQREPGSDPRDVDCACDNQAGRFRKIDAYDCGNRGCWICHGGKFPKRKRTRQEVVAGLRFEEQWREFCQGNH